VEIVMKPSNYLLISAVALFGLAACGGGGGSGGTPTPDPVTLVTVNSGNATQVTAAAAGAAFGSVEIGGLVEIVGSNGTEQGGLTKQIAKTAATKVAQVTLSSFKFIPLGPETSPCVVSGSVTVSGDIADPFTFTAGDVINIDSDMCDDDLGEIIDGLLEMTISSFDGDILTSEFLFGVDLVVTDFMVITPNVTSTANGDVGTTIDTRTPPVAEGSIFGDSFVVSQMGETQSMTNFSTIYTEDSSTFPISWTNNSIGTADSSEFSGSVSYETPMTFEGSGENFAHTGRLLTTGANGATLLLRTIDDVNVEIDADYDGDGTVDETFVLTWSELQDQS
jgi:hypothetical protein